MKKNANNKAGDFDFRTIKSFEDACARENVSPDSIPDVSMIPDEFRKSIIAAYKLFIVFKAINNKWVPNWGDWDQYKYYPWFEVLSSGFGFSGLDYYCAYSDASVGSRLCTDTSEKALYIAKTFEPLYKDYLLITE